MIGQFFSLIDDGFTPVDRHTELFIAWRKSGSGVTQSVVFFSEKYL